VNNILARLVYGLGELGCGSFGGFTCRIFLKVGIALCRAGLRVPQDFADNGQTDPAVHHH